MRSNTSVLLAASTGVDDVASAGLSAQVGTQQDSLFHVDWIPVSDQWRLSEVDSEVDSLVEFEPAFSMARRMCTRRPSAR